MKTIRVLNIVVILLIISFYSINRSSNRAQAETTEALKVSEADQQREKQEFISLMEGKIAPFRRSLDEMKALACNAPSPARIEITKHSEEMERQIKAAEKNLAELKGSSSEVLE